MTEQQLQTKIKNKLQKEGWEIVKLIKTSWNGIPDLMCLRNGQTMFIEVKKEKTGVLSELQNIRIKMLRDQGFITKIWTDYETDFKGGNEIV